MSTLFMVFALLFPRITLLVTWLFGTMPVNDTPFWADALATLFAPRFLLAYWAYGLHEHIVWVALFVIVGIIELLGSGNRVSRSDSK